MRCAQRKAGLALGGEVVLVGTAAFLGVLTAAHASGARLDRPEAWVLASFGALCGGWTLYLERRISAPELAAQIDRRLGQEGALVTAYERAGQGPLVDLLERRVRSEVRASDARRALPTHPLPFLALPLAAAVALAGSLERARSERTVSWAVEAVARLEEDVQEAVEEAYAAREEGRMSGEEFEQLLEEKASVRSLAAEAAAAAEAGDAGSDLEAPLRELARELSEAARDLAHCPEVSSDLERAALRADGALMGLDPDSQKVPHTPESNTNEAGPAGSTRPPGTEPKGSQGLALEAGAGSEGASEPAGAENEEDGSSGPGLAQDTEDGRMSGSPAPPEGSQGPERPDDPGPDRAPAAASLSATQVHGPFWSPSQAPLLERWMDARRRRLESSER